MMLVDPAPKSAEAYSEFALVGAQRRIGTGQRLENRIVHMDAGAIDRRDHILQGAGRDRNHVHAHFEPGGHHAQRIIYPGLIVENEFLRQQMQNFAIVAAKGSLELCLPPPEVLRGQSHARAHRNSIRRGC